MQLKKRFSIIEREDILNKGSRCLWGDNGLLGRNYLTLQRKLSKLVIRQFQLGYIPQYVKHQLRGRIIIPLFDSSENLIAIGSRAIGTSDFLPVYWHESYEKSFYLYGIHLARSSMRKLGFVVVCEGQFDVLQLQNHGIKNVVGLCGNKLSDVQVSVIQRYCNDIVLLLDTDANQAGQVGAQKAIEKSAFKYGKEKIVVNRHMVTLSFSENADPDDFVKKYGVDKLKNLVKGKLNDLRHSSNS